MIETKLIISSAQDPKWQDRTRMIASRRVILFGAFHYRIFGEVFTKRSTEFDTAFDQYLVWRRLCGSV